MVRAQHPLLIGQQLLEQVERPAGITTLRGEQRDLAARGERFGMSFTNLGGEALFPAFPPLKVLGGNHRLSLGQARDHA